MGETGLDSIVIRRAEPRDAALLVGLMDEVGREEGAWLLATDAGRSVVEERRYLRAVRRHHAAAVFVADDGGELVGRLSVARDQHPASAHVADLGLLVASPYRRRGLGRRLLRQAVVWAEETGVRKLELHVFPWNEPALALYNSFGFVREGYRVGHYVRAGMPVDAILMAYYVVPVASSGRGTTPRESATGIPPCTPPTGVMPFEPPAGALRPEPPAGALPPEVPTGATPPDAS